MRIYVFSIAIFFLSSCDGSWGDARIDIDENYKLIADSPYVIIYQKEGSETGGGKIIIPPNVVYYANNDSLILAISLDMDNDYKKCYWRVIKEDREAVSIDSVGFYNNVKKLDLELIDAYNRE